MNKRFLLSLLGLVVTFAAMALTTPEEGKYYRIVNLNPDKSINTEGVRHGFVITENPLTYRLRAESPGSDTQYTQLWKYTGGKFQNAHTDHYIQANSSRSSQFQAGKTGATVQLDNKEYFFILTCGMQIHADGSNNIVAWNDVNNPSNHWDFEEVEVNEAELVTLHQQYAEQEAKRAELEAIAAQGDTYAPMVQKYFADFACTTFKPEYEAMDEAALTQDMAAQGLPQAIQEVVLRIKNHWADEINPTLSAKFRVQEYKCYTKANAKWNSNTTQMADMNNPTGIWTTPVEVLYVFVDTDAPAGTELRLSTSSGSEIAFANINGGTTLHKGMNIIYKGTDMAYNWIMYNVDCDLQKLVADNPAVKIHIEGGQVLGYADVAGLDEAACNALYKTTLMNAAAVLDAAGVSHTKINFPVKGEYGLMWFPVDVYEKIWGSTPLRGGYTTDYSIYKPMQFYDSALKWEWSVMGFMDRVYNGEAVGDYENLAAGCGDSWYPSRYNNLAPAMMLYNGKNPYSSDSYTCMPSLWAVESSYNANRVDFDVWCVGHESGHNNQGTINMPSSTEASNNYFSDIVQYLSGFRLSRGGTFRENMNYQSQGLIFPHRDIGMTLRMWYNLYLYYHRAQKNTAFSPTLFKLLRADGMRWNDDGSYNDGVHGSCTAGRANSCWIKFYKKACQAAQEDLTEYFRLWGFFIPCDHAFCGDYGNYYLTLTQKEIDDAIKWVKKQNWPENKQIMFVEDRLEPLPRHIPWGSAADNAPLRQNTDGGDASNEASLKATFGDMGNYTEYMGTPVAPNYSYSVSGCNVTMTGQGGVGIIVYDDQNNIVFLSNSKQFTLPASVANGSYTIVCIDAAGNETPARDVLVDGTPDEQKAALEQALAATTVYTSLEDPTGTKVGYYTSESLADLDATIAAAQKAIKDGDSSQYVALTRALGSELIAMEQTVQKISVQPNGLYTIRNKARNTYLNNNNPGSDANAASSKWAFIPVPEKPGYYYMQNYETRQLINDWYTVEGKTKAAAKQVYLSYLRDGAWNLKMTNEKGNLATMHNQANGNCIVTWQDNADGSLWYITRVADIEEVPAATVSDLINETQTLMDQIGTVTTSVEKLPLQCTDATAPYYVKTNRPNTSYPLANLLDGNKQTSFYTNQGGTTQHNLTIDLGEGNEANYLRVTFCTSRETCNELAPQYGRSPSAFEVTPSTGNGSGFVTADKSNFEELPDGKASQVTYYRDTKESAKAYRYWRIRVSGVNTTAESGFPYFGLAYMQLRTLVASVVLNPGFENFNVKYLKNAKTGVAAAQTSLDQLDSYLTNKAAYDALKKIYDTLLGEAQATGVEGIDAATDEPHAVYDLQGRQLQRAGEKGVYVIDGQKVMVK